MLSDTQIATHLISAYIEIKWIKVDGMNNKLYLSIK